MSQGYSMSNEGTKIPSFFKKSKAARKPGIAKGKALYVKAIKDAKKGK